MHLIHIRLSKPTQEDVKYLNNRLSSKFKAKQILPTLWLTFEEFDSIGNFITSESIEGDLNGAADKISVKMSFFIAETEWDNIEFNLPPDKVDWITANAR